MGRINIVKMSILPKAVYKFNTVSTKIPRLFFTDIGKTISEFMWRPKRPRTAKANLSKENTVGDIT